MTKQDVLEIFGGRVEDAASVLGITRQGIHHWTATDNLPRVVADRVLGALYRQGMFARLAQLEAAERPTAESAA